ncbi:MAG: hypothetical protein H6765_04860 [Candidatus Peribacteria bacterium]|nr:MAG: hypothetical protein H6765_04860 [Candidatus Peribacteria bacterium]
MVQAKDALTYQLLADHSQVTLWPATQYMQDLSELDSILARITQEMEEQVKIFTDAGRLTEAQRLKKRVSYDCKMIKETGFVNGIENYSPYFENRLDGAPPNTLFDYFPDDFLLIVDESHMTIPQLGAMPRGDHSRKTTLTEHGFRLPSAAHHRPINFEELQVLLDWEPSLRKQVHPVVLDKHKSDMRTLFVSATPAPYEIDRSRRVVQQIIRPTGLLDPLTYVYPKGGDYDYLLTSLQELKTTKSYLSKSLEHADKDMLTF